MASQIQVFYPFTSLGLPAIGRRLHKQAPGSAATRVDCRSFCCQGTSTNGFSSPPSALPRLLYPDVGSSVALLTCKTDRCFRKTSFVSLKPVTVKAVTLCHPCPMQHHPAIGRGDAPIHTDFIRIQAHHFAFEKYPGLPRSAVYPYNARKLQKTVSV